MKKTIFILAATTALLAGIIFAGYRSSAQKQVSARAKVHDAGQDLTTALENTNEAARKESAAEEWITFRNESELKTRENEILVAELNLKKKNPGDISDALYKKKIAYLEQQNEYMKARLKAYEKSQSNWESFKRGFSNEMEVIKNALNDLAVGNKK